jgi:hypothetical protein
LILNGQALHCGELQMIEFARNSCVLLSCLRSHSTKYFLTFETTFAVPRKSTGGLLRAENGCMKSQFDLECAFYGDVTSVWKMLKKLMTFRMK